MARPVPGSNKVEFGFARSMMLALGRPATGKERARADEFLRRHTLVDWCRVLLNLNEFVYVD